MANRSLLYVCNKDNFQELSEGIYQIPAFWQCLWSNKELEQSASSWKELFEKDDDYLEEYFSQNGLEVQVRVSDSHQYALANRAFIESCFPEVLSLYDDFVSYVFKNSQGYDFVGIDVTEVLLMEDDYSDFVNEMTGNLKAMSEKTKQGLGVNFSVDSKSIETCMGYTEFFEAKYPFENETGSNPQ